MLVYMHVHVHAHAQCACAVHVHVHVHVHVVVCVLAVAAAATIASATATAAGGVWCSSAKEELERAQLQQVPPREDFPEGGQRPCALTRACEQLLRVR